ncbi:MAG TPA: hypothetical protein VGL47_41490 [Amycolatopsis sp.]|uniref:hypothetical protein n=1 Tax=Amycolatopsis sp. TaxID=37632 RepID=UPI002F401A3A
MTTPRAEPRALGAVGSIAALTGAATGAFWVAMSGRYDRLCAPDAELCVLGQAFLGLVVLVATIAGTSLLTLLFLSTTRLRPKPPIALAASLAPLVLLIPYNLTGALGAYRIALLAAVSAALQVGVAWAARTGVR